MFSAPFLKQVYLIYLSGSKVAHSGADPPGGQVFLLNILQCMCCMNLIQRALDTPYLGASFNTLSYSNNSHTFFCR